MFFEVKYETQSKKEQDVKLETRAKLLLIGNCLFLARQLYVVYVCVCLRFMVLCWK